MGGAPADFDTVIDLCRDRHRRIVLAALADHGRALTLHDLAAAIATENHETTLTDPSESAVASILLSLHHVHLPKLDAAGLVDYDPDRRLVAPTETFDTQLSQLSVIVDVDPNLDGSIEL